MERGGLQLLFGAKGEALCKQIFLFRRRFPTRVPRGFFRELGSFLSGCPASFLKSYSICELFRIFLARNWVVKKTEPQGIGVRIVRFDPSRLGIAICWKRTEPLIQENIGKAVQNIIPGIKLQDHASIFYQEQEFGFSYHEVQKMRGGFFSHGERKRLKVELPLELLHAARASPHSIFFPGNEEDVFKNIRYLSRELRAVNDLPQVMVSFVEYTQETLKFLAIVLRVLKPNTPSILEESLHLSSAMNFSLEKILHLGRLRKKYPKEAAIFTLEVKSSLFLQGSNSINLRAARRYVVKCLEHLIGPFRDYNGGLLDQENRQLLKTKELLAKTGANCRSLDEIFYGIKPITLRATISTKILLDLVSLYRELSSDPLITRYRIARREEAVMIQTRERGWKTLLATRLLHTGSSFFEEDGIYYLSFFCPSDSISLFETLQRELRQIDQPSCDLYRVPLRLNFQAGDPISLNPRLAADIHSHTLSHFLFEGLTRFSKEAAIEPAAAEKIEISDLRYIFHIRPSCWSNGEQVSAYHFETAWKRALMGSSASSFPADIFYPIRNARKAREQKVDLSKVGIRAKNAKTLCVDLERPCSHFLNLLATPLFFPSYGEVEEPLVFNGPYSLVEWKRGEQISLSPNPFYWNFKKTRPSGIAIRMIRNPAQTYRLFRKGELDLIGDPYSPLPPSFLQKPSIQKQLKKNEISRVFWIHCNHRVFPLHNAHLRRALNVALHRGRLIEKAFFGQLPLFSPLPLQYSSIQGPIEGDPQLARRHFHWALEELGIKKEEFPELVLTHSDLSFEAALFEELRKQWKEVLGISLRAKPLSWSAFSSALEKGEFQLGGLFRRNLYNDPTAFLSFFRNSATNPHRWDNKEYEQLLNKMEMEGRSVEIFRKIEQVLLEQSPVIPIVNQCYLILMNRHLKGLEWNQNGCIEIE